MPIYKGNTEIASGKLYKAAINIENGYKGTDSFYINEVTISFLNFPSVSDYSITGGPGETIPGNRYQQWTATAPSGYAFNGTQTVTGLPADFTFTAGSTGSTSDTTTSPRVNYAPSVFPTSSVSVDYNNLTVSLPTSQVVTLSYTFTGGLGRSTSCTTFAGSSCGVSSNSQFAGHFEYWTGSASGTGGYGANACYQGCSVSISSSGGSSSCDINHGTSSQSASIQMACNIPDPSGTVWGNYYCATISTGSASSICGGYSIETKRADSASFSGGGSPSSSCSGTPTWNNSGNYRLIGYGGTSSVFDPARGTWESRVRAGNGTVKSSASCTVN
jgi:hypothetical protein